MTLPTDRDERNALLIWEGCIMYFPDVWAEIAKVSALGNKQHKLGGKLRWERSISTDHLNKVMRHMLDHGAGNVLDDEGQTFHLAKAIWRLCAQLQLTIEAERKRPAVAESALADAALARMDLRHAQRETVNAAVDRLAIASESPEESLAARSPAPLIRPLFGHQLD